MASTSPEFLLINGNRIHVVDKNSDRDITLVFIHGRCLSVNSWEHQLASERLAEFRLVAFDLPGHGMSSRSDNPMNDYSLQGSIRILTEVIRQLQLKKFYLIGYSLGGHIALEAIPELPDCQGVFAMTLPITKPMQFDKMYVNGELLGRVYIDNPTPEDVSMYAQSLLKPDSGNLPDFLESDFYKTDPQIHQAIVQGIIAGDYEDEAEIIQNSHVPVAIVAGLQEQVHDLAYLDNLTLSVWQANPLLIPDAGHLLPWENPEVVNQWLYTFVEEHKH
jgi:pimeloyl-ACP methyl ester carboxylesterase